MAQVDTPEAYEIVRKMMRDGDKDATRLAAARTILQIAGIPMGSTSSDGESRSPSPTPAPPSTTPTKQLMALVKPLSTPFGGGAN